MDRSKDPNRPRAYVFFLLLVIAAMAVKTASAREIGYLELFAYTGEPTRSGFGYLIYESSSLDRVYELRDAWLDCRESSDPTACDILPTYIEYSLEITDAKFTWLDTVFTTDDFSWYAGMEMNRNCAPTWTGCYGSSYIEIANGPNYIWVDCLGGGQVTDTGLNQSCGMYYALDFYVGGRGGSNDYDGSRFRWREATPPSSVSEPTALGGLIALFALGLSSRRRKGGKGLPHDVALG